MGSPGLLRVLMKFVLIIIVNNSFYCFSQSSFEDLNSIDEQLSLNADAVIRSSNIEVVVKKYDKVIITKNRWITILNRDGWKHADAYTFYDNTSSIKKMTVTLYDVNGEKIETIKEKNFKDEAAVAGGTLYSDNRVKRLEYTPRSFPFTVHFESVKEVTNTAFLPSFNPIENYRLAVQNSTYKLINETDDIVHRKELRLEKFNVSKTSDSWSIKNVPGIEYEPYSTGLSSYVPIVKFALSHFSMAGVEGFNKDWKEFGKWMNEELYQEIYDVPESVITAIKSKTAGLTTDKEKAKYVYEYMQDRSRYISVQVGIGGWKPINAGTVNDTGYGDCKGLTNYTKAILDRLDIKSYHTVIYGGGNIEDIDKSFSSTQGNHMILYLPDLEGEEYWLECTSKNDPFGYIAGWTDDRDALVITEDGGIIKHTKIYDTTENQQIIKSTVTLKSDTSLNADLSIETSGYQYSFRSRYIEYSNSELTKLYKAMYNNFYDLNISNIRHLNDKDDIVYKEDLSLSSSKIGAQMEELWLIQPLMFNGGYSIPSKVENRKFNFEIDRGYVDIDEYHFILDNGVTINTLMDKKSLKTEFGYYELTTEKTSDGFKLLRKIQINKGAFSKDKYEAYRDFREKINELDKTKVLLNINN